MPYIATILITLFLSVPAISTELFRYRGAAKDGGTLEYFFEAGKQNAPNAVTKEKAAEIAADFMTTFHQVQLGALETQEFRKSKTAVTLFPSEITLKIPHNLLIFGLSIDTIFTVINGKPSECLPCREKQREHRPACVIGG